MNARVQLCPPSYEIIGPINATGMRPVCLVWHAFPVSMMCLQDDRVPQAGLFGGLPCSNMDVARRMVGYGEEVQP